MDKHMPSVHPAPTPQRPLLGQTVLVVEDSRYASEALRQLALRSGARIRRADCIASAERHLLTYRAGIAIVDLGLPDGSGLSLIERLSQANQRPLVVMATSGRDDMAGASLAAGADGFLPKPVESLAQFQQAIMRHMPPDLWPKGLRSVSADTVEPDTLALSDDLKAARRMLDDGAQPRFVAEFLCGLARTGRDEALLTQSQSLATRVLDDIRPDLNALIDARLNKLDRAV